ncbi:MAG TPA: hypothetical protein VKU02_08515 [Gemmataceae bacterium]|nr:hypothetical protein [Gemmataceae bacterium]
MGLFGAAAGAIGIVLRAATAVPKAVAGNSHEEKGRAALAGLLAERKKQNR